MSVLSTTANYGFRKIDFDSSPWHEDEYANWDLVDALFTHFIGITGILGLWANATLYEVGDRVIDDDDGTLWECDVEHTSHATLSFTADRAANPTYWDQITGSGGTAWGDITGKPTTVAGYAISDVYTDAEVDTLLASYTTTASLTTLLAAKNDLGVVAGISTYTDSATLALSDKGKLVLGNKGSGMNITVPPNSSVAFPIGTVIPLGQIGAGQVTIVEGSGVTIKSLNSDKKLAGNGATACLIKYLTDTWLLGGNITA